MSICAAVARGPEATGGASRLTMSSYKVDATHSHARQVGKRTPRQDD